MSLLLTSVVACKLRGISGCHLPPATARDVSAFKGYFSYLKIKLTRILTLKQNFYTFFIFILSCCTRRIEYQSFVIYVETSLICTVKTWGSFSPGMALALNTPCTFTWASFYKKILINSYNNKNFFVCTYMYYIIKQGYAPLRL